MLKFLTIDCPRCDRLEDKLRQKNIDFERIDDRKISVVYRRKDGGYGVIDIE